MAKCRLMFFFSNLFKSNPLNINSSAKGAKITTPKILIIEENNGWFHVSISKKPDL